MQTRPTQNGRISKAVSVETDAPGARSFQLRFSAEVEAPVLAMPTLRFVLSAVEGEPAESRILLRRTDGRDLKVGISETGNPALVARSEVISKRTNERGLQTEPGDLWLVLETKPGQRVVNSSGSLEVTTNHPDLPVLKIPYTIRVRPLITVSPATARLWPSNEAAGRGRAAITLTAYAGKKFRITGIEVSDPKLFLARKDSQSSSTRHRLWVELAEDAGRSLADGRVTGFVRIHTDLPGREDFRLPVLVESSPPKGVRTMHGKPQTGGSR